MELMKVETPHHHEDDKIRVLFEASYKGSVSTLNSLIQKDPIILHKINSRSVFTETPLHISARLGHLEFTKVLLTHKRQLARELNSFQSTALHLASAEGHIDVVKVLLEAYDDACLAADQEGRIPLHYAVMRGRIEVVRELIGAKPESLRILDKGKTIFHLCVTYNQLEILKTLVELELDIDTSELLNLGDFDGNNTVLHLAIMLKQVETVGYLLSILKRREAANLENETHSIASDILNRSPKDLKILESRTENNKRTKTPRQSRSSIGIDVLVDEAERPPVKGWRKLLMIIGNNLKHNGDWLEEMRGNLSLVATVISTITFQAVINPPGGFVQQGINEKSGPFDCLPFEDGTESCPGDAISAIKYEYYFCPFLKYNTMSFIASLSVILLLISGVPLKHKPMIWMLSIGMCITLTALALTYLNALYLVTPDGKLFHSATEMFKISISGWIALLGFVAAFITLRFLFWLVKRYKKKFERLILLCPRIGNENI